MKRREFIIDSSLLATGSFLSPVFSNSIIKESSTWIWIRPSRDFKTEDWKLLFAKCRQHGIKSVLLEVYNGDTCIFTHPVLPSANSILNDILPIARNEGVAVHAWMWTMICNNNSILKEHPDWYAVNGLGQPSNTSPAYVGYYRFMCPRNPQVREFISTTVRTLAEIEGLAGIHLDYVRLPDVILASGLQPKYNIVQDKEYPQYDYCYCDYCRSSFQNLYNVVPSTAMDDQDMTRAWLQFRMDSVTELVNKYLAPIARSHDKFMSAAVFPNWLNVRQQWMNWDLDAFFPMLYNGFYNENYDWIFKQTRSLKRLQKFHRPVFSGLFLPHVPAVELHNVIKGCKNAGASGIALFDYNGMTDAYWEALLP